MLASQPSLTRMKRFWKALLAVDTHTSKPRREWARRCHIVGGRLPTHLPIVLERVLSRLVHRRLTCARGIGMLRRFPAQNWFSLTVRPREMAGLGCLAPSIFSMSV